MKEDMNHVYLGMEEWYRITWCLSIPTHATQETDMFKGISYRVAGWVEKGRATLSNSSSSILPSSRDQIHTAQDRTHGRAEVGIIAAGYLLQVVKAEEMPHIVMFFPNWNSQHITHSFLLSLVRLCGLFNGWWGGWWLGYSANGIGGEWRTAPPKMSCSGGPTTF